MTSYAEEETDSAIHSLWECWRADGGPSVRNEIFEHYFPWCRKVCSVLFLSYRHNLVEWHDFVHVASLKLISLIEDFDHHRGVPFRAYAYPALRGAVINEIKTFSKDYEKKNVNLISDYRHERLPSVSEEADSFNTIVDTAIGLAFGMFLELGILESMGEEHSPQHFYEKDNTRAEIIALVDALGEREKFVVKGHYFQHLRFQELAEIMGVSAVRVSQLHKNGLKSLRELFEKTRVY